MSGEWCSFGQHFAKFKVKELRVDDDLCRASGSDFGENNSHYAQVPVCCNI